MCLNGSYITSLQRRAWRLEMGTLQVYGAGQIFSPHTAVPIREDVGLCGLDEGERWPAGEEVSRRPRLLD